MHPTHLPVLYAEVCPNQPTMPQMYSPQHQVGVLEDVMEDQLSQATRVITRKNYVQEFRPKIIKPKRIPFHHSFQLMERDRENKSMKNRIENVKNLQQRRKDKTDPIIYPPYFVRGGGRDSDVRIDSYMKKALNNTTWKQKQRQLNKIYDQDKSPSEQEIRHRKSLKKHLYPINPHQQQKTPTLTAQNPEYQSQMPSPIFHRRQPTILKPVQSTPTYITKKDVLRLPQNDIRSILDYIYHNLMYKDKDLQALKSRMIHAYGKQQIQNTWKLSMRLLERDI